MLAAIGIPVLFIATIYLTGRTTEPPAPIEWSIQQVVANCGKPAMTIPDKYGEPGTMIYRSRHGGEFFLKVSEGRVRSDTAWLTIDDLPCLAKTR